MVSRSPKLDDPEFTKKISVPGLSSMQVSARDLIAGDYSNLYFNSLTSVLRMVEDEEGQFADVIDDFGIGRTPYRTFAEVYRPETHLHLASLQDPEDVAELDAVAEGLNVLFAEQRVTNAAVKELLARAGAVFDKYKG